MDSLEPHWRALTGNGSRPFQEFGWCRAWLDTIGRNGGRQPHLVTVWQEDALIGLLPLVARRFKGVRLLEWIGTKVTDYCDVILRHDVDNLEVLDRMWECLRDRGGFDVWRAGQVRSDARVRPLLNRLPVWVETQEEAFALPLVWEDGESWLRAQSSKSRARVRRGIRRLAELGMRFQIWQTGEPLEPLLDSVIRQKQHWAAERQVESFVSEPQGPEFLHELARQLANSGSLHLSVLRCRDDEIAATHFGFYRDGIFYYYLPTYDFRYSSQRVGTLLLDTLIRWCCDHGARRFDMLLGAHEYKASYGVQPESVQTLLYGRGLLGKAAVAFYKATCKQ